MFLFHHNPGIKAHTNGFRSSLFMNLYWRGSNYCVDTVIFASGFQGNYASDKLPSFRFFSKLYKIIKS